MKLLKFKLKRATLNQIYLSYLRPILDYASIIWDNCTAYENELLEKLQYDAARAVTGLTRSVSIKNLLNEIGWVSLSVNDQQYFESNHSAVFFKFLMCLTLVNLYLIKLYLLRQSV